jgi:hypothetical protein
MSALLIKWINGEFNLKRKITFLERDLSNGYLLGELLHALNLESNVAAYTDADDVASTLGNFEQVALTLKEIGINMNVDLARSIMMEKKGAVSKVRQTST